ncbi:hypothetical protein M8J77_006705 [Diaphorina citri]|nr:hypothetical protein M8J77_006705 [Diaphorina citri]
MKLNPVPNFVSRFDEVLYKYRSSVPNFDQSASLSEKLIMQHYSAQLCFYSLLLLLKKTQPVNHPGSVLDHALVSNPDSFKEKLSGCVPPLLLALNPGLVLEFDPKSHGTSGPDNIDEMKAETNYRISQCSLFLGMLKKYGFVYDNHVQNAFKSKDWLDSMYSRIFSAGVTSSDKSYMKSFLAKHKPPSDVPLTVAQLCNLRPEHVSGTELSHPYSLHHMVWLGVSLMLGSDSSLPPPSFKATQVASKIQFAARNIHLTHMNLCSLDVDAFLYASVFCALSHLQGHTGGVNPTSPPLLPADITPTDLLVSSEQAQWWSQVHSLLLSQEHSATQAAKDRGILAGVSLVRNIAHNSLHVSILVCLARMFAARASDLRSASVQDQVRALETRSQHYWECALPSLQRLEKNKNISGVDDTLFRYHGEPITSIEASAMIEEGKCTLGCFLLNNNKLSEASNMFKPLKSAFAKYNLAKIYVKLAEDELYNASSAADSSILNSSLLSFNGGRGEGPSPSHKYFLFLQKAKESLVGAQARLDSELNAPSYYPDLGARILDLLSDVEMKLETADGADQSTLNLSGSSFVTQRGQADLSVRTEYARIRHNNSTRLYFSPEPSNLNSMLLSNHSASNKALEAQVELILERLKRLQDQFERAERPEPGSSHELARSVAGLNERLDGMAGQLNEMHEKYLSILESIKDLVQDKTDVIKNITENLSSLATKVDILMGQDDLEDNYQDLLNPEDYPEISPAFYSGLQSAGGGKATSGMASVGMGAGPGFYGAGALTFSEGQTLPNFYNQQILPPGVSVPPAVQPATIKPIPTGPPPQLSSTTQTSSNATKIPPTSTSTADVKKPLSSGAPHNVVITTSDRLPIGPPTAAPQLSVLIPPQHLNANKPKFAPNVNPPASAPGVPAGTTGIAGPIVFGQPSAAPAVPSFTAPGAVKPAGVLSTPPWLPKDTALGAPLFGANASTQPKDPVLGQPLFGTNTLTQPKDSALGAPLFGANAFSGPPLFGGAPLFGQGAANAFGGTVKPFAPTATSGASPQQTGGAGFATTGFSSPAQLTSSPLGVSTTGTANSTPIKPSANTSLGGQLNTSQIGGNLNTSGQIGGPLNTSGQLNSSQTGSGQTTPHKFQIQMPHESLSVIKKQLETSPLIKQSLEQANESDDETTANDHDPLPDFKPIIPLPDEVPVTTGEENETVLFEQRAKLYRFVDKEWKERGVGQLKLLKNKDTGKVRLLMRRDIVHKICANHFLHQDMELKPMPNTKQAYIWFAQDYADEVVSDEQLCAKFKLPEDAERFRSVFNQHKADNATTSATQTTKPAPPAGTVGFSKELTRIKAGSWECKQCYVMNQGGDKCVACNSANPQAKATTTQASTTPAPTSIFGTQAPTPTFGKGTPTFGAQGTPTFGTQASSTFGTPGATSFGFKFSAPPVLSTTTEPSAVLSTTTESNAVLSTTTENAESDDETTANDHDPLPDFKPIIPLPDEVPVTTGEENETVLFEQRAKLYRFVDKEWKERGVGQLKLLKNKDTGKVRLLMRRDIVHKICANHFLHQDMELKPMSNTKQAYIWFAQDYADEVVSDEQLCAKFKLPEDAERFRSVFTLHKADNATTSATQTTKPAPPAGTVGFSKELTRIKAGSWECKQCYVMNQGGDKCVACNSANPQAKPTTPGSSPSSAAQPPTSTATSKYQLGGLTFSSTPVLKKDPSTESKAGDKSKNAPEAASKGAPFAAFSFTTLPAPGTPGVNPFSALGGGSSGSSGFSFGTSQPSSGFFGVAPAGGNLFGAKGFVFGTSAPDGKDKATSAENKVTSAEDKVKTEETSGGFPTLKNLLSTPNASAGEDSSSTKDAKPQPRFSFGVPKSDGDSAPVAVPQFKPATNLPTTGFTFGVPPAVSSASNETAVKPAPETPAKSQPHTDEVEIVFEKVPQLSEEERALTLKYSLPPHFYQYKSKDPCPGCVGCEPEDPDDQAVPNSSSFVVPTQPILHKSHLSVPKLSSTPKEGDSRSGSSVSFGSASSPIVAQNTPTGGDSLSTLDSEKASTPMGNIFTINSSTSSPANKTSNSGPFGTTNLFGQSSSSMFGSAKDSSGSLFTSANAAGSPFAAAAADAGSPDSKSSPDAPKFGMNVGNLFGGKSTGVEPPTSGTTTTTAAPFGKNLFGGSGDKKSLFSSSLGSTTFGSTVTPGGSLFGSSSGSVFGSTAPGSTVFGSTTTTGGGSVFGSTTTTASSAFGAGGSVFGATGVFGTPTSGSSPFFGAKSSEGAPTGGSTFGASTQPVFGTNTNASSPAPPQSDRTGSNAAGAPSADVKPGGGTTAPSFLDKVSTAPSFLDKVSAAPSFADLASKSEVKPFSTRTSNFTWEGAGASVFKSVSSNQTSSPSTQKNTSTAGDGDEEEEAGDGGEHDPHFEPIIPLPDIVEVKTGEEDETKLYGERCKLYRYDKDTKEWKERGVGELKLLFHPEKLTYRLLMRREQIHKTVANFLLWPGFELRPMSSSDKAWVLTAMNLAEDYPEPELEELAVRFKNVELAHDFKAIVDNAVQRVVEIKANSSSHHDSTGDHHSPAGSNHEDEEEEDGGEEGEYVEEEEDQYEVVEEEEEEEEDEDDEDDDDVDYESILMNMTTLVEHPVTLLKRPSPQNKWETIAWTLMGKYLIDHPVTLLKRPSPQKKWETIGEWTPCICSEYDLIDHPVTLLKRPSPQNKWETIGEWTPCICSEYDLIDHPVTLLKRPSPQNKWETIGEWTPCICSEYDLIDHPVTLLKRPSPQNKWETIGEWTPCICSEYDLIDHPVTLLKRPSPQNKWETIGEWTPCICSEYDLINHPVTLLKRPSPQNKWETIGEWTPCICSEYDLIDHPVTLLKRPSPQNKWETIGEWTPCICSEYDLIDHPVTLLKRPSPQNKWETIGEWTPCICSEYDLINHPVTLLRRPSPQNKWETIGEWTPCICSEYDLIDHPVTLLKRPSPQNKWETIGEWTPCICSEYDLINHPVTLLKRPSPQNKWETIGGGSAKIDFDSDTSFYKVVVVDNNSEITLDTLITEDTTFQTKGKAIVWRGTDHSLEHSTQQEIMLKFSTDEHVETFLQFLHEGVTLAKDASEINVEDD